MPFPRRRQGGTMNYRETMEYMEQSGQYGISPGLDSVRELCRSLGDPQQALSFIHIAGTNGKGSVGAYIASVLKCGGYTVGRYLSPAIFDCREEIQVNDRYITKKALCEGMELVKEACDRMTERGLPHPTLFEMKTALAFWYYREKKCDIVVLEAGMGGLLDATNVVENTCVAVVTSISMDHMKFLGNTLAEIAVQKAGIFKEGCRVVTGRQEPEVMEVIREKAAAKDCPVTAAASAGRIRYGLEKQRFDYGSLKDMEITLGGQYQIENAALALAAIQVLEQSGFAVSEQNLRRGMAQCRWPGRFSVVSRKPYFIVDGAHNEDAAQRLADSIEYYFPQKRILYIMGMLKDKECEKIIQRTHFLADQIITVTPPENPRALPAYALAQKLSEVHDKVTAADSLEEAVEMSRLLAGKEDVIIAFGSLSFLGRLMKIAETGSRNEGAEKKAKEGRKQKGIRIK